MARIKMAPPWETYYEELDLLFEEDSDVSVLYDHEENEIRVYVDDGEKADALSQVLPEEKVFGNVTLKIKVVPSNKKISVGKDLFQIIFWNNPIVSYIHTVDYIFTNSITYVVFKPEIVQYFNDNLGDVNGLCTTLYQDIAKRIFEQQPGVFFCTDTVDPDGNVLGSPTMKWP